MVIDHYVGGDGTPTGSRTMRTLLPAAMAKVEPGSLSIDYRDQTAAIAQRYFPGAVGVNIDGFAGRFIQEGRVGT